MSASIMTVFARSVGFTGACVLLAVIVNVARSDGLPLVAPREYEIYVPCPETETEAETITADEVGGALNVTYVDARPAHEFAVEHIKGAISVPYPMLDGAIPDEQLNVLKRRGGKIVTYGRGADNDMGDVGEFLAALLTELGVPNVSHLEGGITAWKAQRDAVDAGEEGEQ